MKRLTTKEIMDVIDTHGDVTRRTLADRLNTNIQTVRYHLRALLRAGKVQVVRTTCTRSSELKWYGRPRALLPKINHEDCLQSRLRAAVELELCAVLDQWGPWTSLRHANSMLHALDLRIHALASHEQAALSCEHNAVLVWRFARINQVEAYRSAINRLLDE